MNKYCQTLTIIALLCVGGQAYAATGSGCVKSSGIKALDQTTAKAIAKGNLSHELGTTVSASTSLETKTIETGNNVQTQDTITESITLSSKNFVSRVQTTDEGYELIKGEKYYCIYLKQ